MLHCGTNFSLLEYINQGQKNQTYHICITPGIPTLPILGTILKTIETPLDINVTATLSADAPHKNEVEELLNTVAAHSC